MIPATILSFLACFFAVPLTLGFLRALGVYAIVDEGTCHVYVLFGKVIGTLREAGLSFLWPSIGWKALIVNIIGRRYVLDMRLDQCYLRSQPVNSE